MNDYRKRVRERDRSEDALKEKNRLNELLMDSLPHFAMLIRKDRTVLAANRIAREAGAKIGGYCWRDFGQSAFISDEDREYYNAHEKIPIGGTHCWFCLADEALAKQEPTDNEVKAWGKIWDTYWVPLDGGTYLHYAFDITERKRTEAALRESERKYRFLFENVEIAIGICDHSGRVLALNKAMSGITGYTLEGFAKINMSDTYVNPENRRKFLDALKREGRVENFEAQLKRKEGETYWASLFGRTIQYNGKDAILTSVLDITKRKQADEERERLMSAIEQAAEAIVITDTEATIQYVNPAFERITGYTREEVKGENPRILKSGKQDDAFYRNMWDTLLSGDVWKDRFVNKKKDGTLFTEESVISPVRDVSGQTINYVAAKRDITKEMKLEDQLRQAQKMETIGILAGGVAHDLNNILSGIVSYPELILMELPEESPLRKPISTIQKSGEKAAVVVQDLLTLARRGVSITEVVNINHIISEQLKSPEFEKLMSYNRDVRVETHFEKDLLNIKGSTAHLSKSVMNLLSNAAEAMMDGGTIFISTENRYVDRPVKGYDSIEEGDYVALMVSDTGIGMSSEDQERIFEPFYTKKAMGRSGTGLGMAVVWGTVKDHNGYIDLKSSVGKGTTFTLYFPVTRDKEAADESLLSIEEYKGRGETILVIDDVEEQREIASGMLRKLGYSVTSVSSGEEAVEYMKNETADLLVLDMIMDPGIDGLETYQRILKLHPGQKAIIASGFSETDRVREAMKLGAGAYIKKPYLIEKIGVAVKTECAGSDE